ncbi:MAG: peptidylprolyl isomerase [Planctomycetes bacterium]|nr:peptidylprolyl isomerase [Planctomycetota bacterium]
MVLNVTLKNNTGQPRRTIKPLIDFNSLSFDIDYGSASPTNAPKISFAHTAFTPSITSLDKATLPRVDLAPGETFQSSFKVPAIQAGAVKIKARYEGLTPPLISNELNLQIKSAPDKKPVGVIETNHGRIVVSFYPKVAPNTVLNFIQLAQKDFYNGLIFHRIIPGFMIQGGCPNKNGSGSPGYTIPAEFNDRKHLTGTLSMARSQLKDSGGSQFYICLAPRPDLDNKYTVFGTVIEGFDVLQKIGRVKTSGPRGNPPNRPLEEVTIKSVTIETR